MSDEIVDAEVVGAVKPYIPPTRTIVTVPRDRGDECSFDIHTPEGAELLVKCTLHKLPDLFGIGGKFINVVHIFAHDIDETNDETGEVMGKYRRTVIITDEGIAYSCGSKGVDKALQVIKAIRGEPPFTPAIKCEVRIERIDNNKNWMYLSPDIQSLLQNTKRPAPQRGKKPAR
jgi:hypothetical protein